MAINPAFFADNFEDRLQDLINHCRTMEPIDPAKPVLVPGDPERINMKKSDVNNGIAYHVNQVKFAVSWLALLSTLDPSLNDEILIFKENLAKELKIEPPKSTLIVENHWISCDKTADHHLTAPAVFILSLFNKDLNLLFN